MRVLTWLVNLLAKLPRFKNLTQEDLERAGVRPIEETLAMLTWQEAYDTLIKLGFSPEVPAVADSQNRYDLVCLGSVKIWESCMPCGHESGQWLSECDYTASLKPVLFRPAKKVESAHGASTAPEKVGGEYA